MKILTTKKTKMKLMSPYVFAFIDKNAQDEYLCLINPKLQIKFKTTKTIKEVVVEFCEINQLPYEFWLNEPYNCFGDLRVRSRIPAKYAKAFSLLCYHLRRYGFTLVTIGQFLKKDYSSIIWHLKKTRDTYYNFLKQKGTAA